jgi:hydroxymethylpyrimidine/phosphomethylpyrimidine kinase
VTDFDRPVVLAIAGVDPTGGAGLFADFETFAEFKVRGLGVVAALTAQTDHRFAGAFPVAGAVLRAQLDAMCAGPIAAVKIGMLGDVANVATVVDAIEQYRLPNVVLDPVLRSTSGGDLLTRDGIDVMRERLLPLTMMITPNADEAGVLLGRSAPRNEAEMVQAARDLRALGPKWVLVKGGHVESMRSGLDVLAFDDECIISGGSRIEGASIRGSGCRLSSAIAARLAYGENVLDALTAAQHHVSWLLGRSVPWRPIMEIA